jgi:hypothetical protein
MRGRLITIAAWLVIIACAVIVAARVHSHYRAPVAPAVFTPAPLVPNASATASTTAAAPVSTRPRPTRTVTTWITVPPSRTATGEDGA